MSGGGHGKPKGRRAQHHEEEEHENHERWLVSYADMVTLLMCLFIVLYAISQVDQKKFDQLASGLAESFGAPIVALSATSSGSSAGVLDAMPAPVDIASEISGADSSTSSAADGQAANAAAAAQAQTDAAAQAAYAQLATARDQLQTALSAAGYPDAAQFQISERGLVVHLIADGLLFDAESATLRPAGKAVLDAIAPTMRGLANQIAVEGHANSVPVTPGGPFASNWDLSTARASRVVVYVTSADAVPETQLSAVGYSDTRPLLPDSDPNAMTVNRRVDVVVLSDASAAANQQLPALDAAASTQGATP